MLQPALGPAAALYGLHQRHHLVHNRLALCHDILPADAAMLFGQIAVLMRALLHVQQACLAAQQHWAS